MPLPNILFKKPNESKVYGVDFSSRLVDSETIATDTVTGGSGLTIGAESNSSGIVSFRVSGGTSGTVYSITVSVTTSANNIYEECIQISVQPCSWMLDMTLMLRFVINDLESTPTYSDARLMQLLCVAGQYVKRDLGITTYTIDISDATITPDPVDEADDVFINLTVLRAACFLDQSSLRTRASAAGVRASLGPMSLQVSDNSVQGFVELLKNGSCAAYQDALRDYAYGGGANSAMWQAVLSPFIHNQFDPRNLGYDRRSGGTNDDGFFSQ